MNRPKQIKPSKQPAPNSLLQSTCSNQPAPINLLQTACSNQPAPISLLQTARSTNLNESNRSDHPLILHLADEFYGQE